MLEETFAPRSAVKHPVHKQDEGIKVHLRFDLTAQPRVSEEFPEEYVKQENFIVRGLIFGTASTGEIASGAAICILFIMVFAPMTIYHYLSYSNK